ncbi:MAG: hypothetical protein ACTSQP_22170 [Promethearchaeota archaeon]
MLDELTDMQKKIYFELSKFDEKAGIAYIGAIKVIKDFENPDRFHQAANSLRHIGAILSRLNESEKTMKEKLEEVILDQPDALPEKPRKILEKQFQDWNSLHDYFIKIAHYGINEINPVEFETNLKRFENTLSILFIPFPEVMTELDKLLSIQKPTQEVINELISLIRHPSHSQYFFTRLKSPEWIDLLHENGFFSGFKDASSHYFMISYLAPFSYLVRISSRVPEKVIEILKEYEKSKNYQLYRSFLICITEMPTDVSKKALYLVRNWVNYYCSIGILFELKKLIKKFIEAKDSESVFKLLKIMFQIKEPKLKEDNYTLDNKFYFIFNPNEDFFDSLLDLEIKNNSCKLVRLLCNTLKEIIDRDYLENSIKSDKFAKEKEDLITNEYIHDYSEIWRHNIEQSYGIEKKNLLVNQLIWTFQRLSELRKDLFMKCLNDLSKYNYPIFKRIQLFFYNKNRELFKKEIKDSLKDKNLILDPVYWNEMFWILKENYEILEEEEKESILRWIEDISILDLTGLEFTREQISELKTKFKQNQIKRILTPIVDKLPEKFIKKFEVVINEIKNMKSPHLVRNLEPVRIFSPPNELKREIQDKDPSELVRFLNEWIPNGDDVQFLSENDLGLALSRLIEENPSKYLGLLEHLKDIPIKYLSFILMGFSASIKNKKDFNFYLILNKVDDFLEISNLNEQYKNDIIKSLLELIDVSLRKKDIDFSKINLNELLGFIKNYALDEEIDIELIEDSAQNLEELYFSYDNTIKGNAIKLLILLLVKNKEKKIFPDKLSNQINLILNELLNKDDSNKDLIISILASNLLNLIYIDEKWVANNLDKIFPRNKEVSWRKAWTGYIIKYKNRLNSTAYKILNKSYLKAINMIKHPKVSFNMNEGLIIHLLLAYVHGIDELKNGSKLALFYKKANSDLRRRAMWLCSVKILDEINKEENVNERDLKYDRILKLWKYRLEKSKKKKPNDVIQEFEWYFYNFSKMNRISEENLDITLLILKKTRGNVGVYIKDILNKLKIYTPINKEKVLDILIEICKSKYQLNLFMSIPDIQELLNLFITEKLEENIKNKIHEIIDNLIRKGFQEFREYYKYFS